MSNAPGRKFLLAAGILHAAFGVLGIILTSVGLAVDAADYYSRDVFIGRT